MWKKDEVIATAFDTTVDMVTRNGWDFVPSTKDKTLSAKEFNKAVKAFQTFNFSEVLDNIIYQMLAYGDAFLELRRFEGTLVKELHPLETTEMRINYNEHGHILGFLQIPSNHASTTQNKAAAIPGTVKFTAEGVIHFRMKWMGSKIYSETPLEPIARQWATKQNAFNYLDQLFMNIHPEIFIHLKGASKEQFEMARETMWRFKTTPQRPLMTYGSQDSSTDVKEIKPNFDRANGLFSVLEYLREAVLMITRVPPVWVGLVNRSGANKGNSEAQVFSFETRIRKIQQKIEHKVNTELMPALGFGHIEFNFNPITFKAEKSALEGAAILSSINVEPKGIVKFLKRNGITDVGVDDFKKPEDMMLGAGNQAARNITSPSRQPSDKMAVKSNLDQTGSSAAGSKKLDEQAMKTRSTTNFNGYPYVITPKGE